ncbi:MAG: nuclear transport factor 2 family protein [Bacteroidia bacterium]|nr:nuclear transport factor 2 family protein [Bacteroidia bacterium]
MRTPEQLATDFYTAFQRGDAAAMGACYHPDARFEDPVFGALSVSDTRDMWAMLITRSKGDLQIRFFDVVAQGQDVTLTWEAEYYFSATRRKVFNQIRTTLRCQDGLIISHQDRFNLWKWASMALGLPGMLLGFTPYFRRRLQTQVRSALARYQQQAGQQTR